VQVVKKDVEKIHMLDVNKEEEGMQEIEDETLCKMEDGSHVKHANTNTEPSQTQQIKKINTEYNENKCIDFFIFLLKTST